MGRYKIQSRDGQLAFWNEVQQPEPERQQPIRNLVHRPDTVIPNVITYWRNTMTETCLSHWGATLWPTTSLWEQIDQKEYDRWVTQRQAIWTWPRIEQLAAQDETIVILGV